MKDACKISPEMIAKYWQNYECKIMLINAVEKWRIIKILLMKYCGQNGARKIASGEMLFVKCCL